MSTEAVKDLCQQVLEQYGIAGKDAFHTRFPAKPVPEISHLCVEFADQAAYEACASKANEWGTVSVRPYNGRDITWCHLAEPLKHDGLNLRWLELLQPVDDKNNVTGVTSIVYAANTVERVEKLPGPDGSNIRFRYQKFGADTLAR